MMLYTNSLSAWEGIFVAKSKLRLVSPTNENRTVTPRRRPNAELRTREHLTEREVERLIEAAKANRHGHRTRALQAYLGHKSIQHTVRYTELAPTRFKGFWRDS
jgi:hypothetical protein